MFSRIRKLRMHSIKTQVIVAFLVVLIPLLIILVTAFYLYSSKIIFRKTVEQSEETVGQLSMSLDHFMEQNINKLETLGDNPTIQEELNADTEELDDTDDSFYSRNRQIRRMMLKEFSSVTMNDMELYGKNGASYYISVWSEKWVIPDENELFRKADEAKGHWILVQGDEEDETLQMIKQIKDLQTYRPLGYIRIGLKRSYLDKLAQPVSFDSQGQIIILDDLDRITSREADEALLSFMESETGSQGSFRYEENGESYMAIYEHSDVTGWDTVGLIYMSYITRDLSMLRNVLLLLSLLAMGIAALVILRISNSLVSPLKETQNALEEFAKGNFEVHLSEERQDEIGTMNAVFNKAICDIQKLMQKVTQAEILGKEMEFKTLQSQMNPHFLYNTLDAINWMAFKNGEDEICNLVSAISNLIRGTISNKKSIITLREELDYIKDYLYIQKLRYQDRLETRYDIDESLLGQAVPKLVIQPIVENAVVHGIEYAQDDSILFISIQRKGEDIDSVVKDTGAGMPQEKAENLLKGSGAEQSGRDSFHTNLGIYAVHKRLQFLYGEEYGLRIISAEGEGTSVTIHIPYEEDSEKLMKTYNGILGEKK